MTIIFTIAFLFFLTTFASGETSHNNLPSIDGFVKSLKELVLSYYPKAEFTINKEEINFEYDTRIFMIHYPLKTGDWQDAVETKGPNKKGILCEISLKSGKYEGAAAVPQTFDYHYFKVFLLCPESSKYNCHLNVRLYYPKNTPEKFIASFTHMVNGIEEFFR